MSTSFKRCVSDAAEASWTLWWKENVSCTLVEKSYKSLPYFIVFVQKFHERRQFLKFQKFYTLFCSQLWGYLYKQLFKIRKVSDKKYEENKSKEKPRRLRLFQFSSFPLSFHVKYISDLNPDICCVFAKKKINQLGWVDSGSHVASAWEKRDWSSSSTSVHLALCN